MLPRFFIDAPASGKLSDHHVITVDGDNAHHMQRVLRLKPDDRVIICDGTGWEFPGRIVSLGDSVTVRLGEGIPSQGEPDVHITLFQGLPKSDKMDWVVQKAAEIGITTVVPVAMDRAVVQLSAKKAVQRVERWQRIATAAAQQAGRGLVPHVAAPKPLTKAITAWREQHTDGLLIVPWEDEAQTSLRAVVNACRNSLHVGVVIGPEGGVTASEVDMLLAAGGRTCTLGPRILRTETAGTVVAALILYELGHMGG